MSFTRRSWLKWAAGGSAGLAVGELVDIEHARAATESLKLAGTSEYTTACNFCACGCGIVCRTRNGELISLEGDPDHAVSQGALCPKGAAMIETHRSALRVKEPMYRAKGSTEWKKISWEEAYAKVAKKIKELRDSSWTATEKVGDIEQPVNRTDTIGFLGGAQHTNEECYLFNKMGRLFGTNYVEHVARVCHGPSVPSLAASFGRGAMTNHWADMQNSKVFLIEGSNVAECHVMGTKWIRKAQDKGAKIIHVDPRFTRTSSMADIFAHIRPGADIAFLSAMINYIIEHKLYDEAYVKLHTNALHVMNDAFGFDAGLFSGYDAEAHKYDTSSWTYALDGGKKPLKAASLDDPRCVFAKLKKHFSRYTLEVGSSISGIPAEQIKLIAETFAANKPGAILYALGVTQHTVGVENIRCYGIIQLLLGNMGKPGGGINALRGQPNVQGACDQSVLNHYMFGYLSSPTSAEATLDAWTKNYGTFRAKFLVNGLKAWYGDEAKPENDYAFKWYPKRSAKKDYSLYGMIDSMYSGDVKMLWVIGQNPMVTQPNLSYVADSLGKLDMLVVQELWDTETSSFWNRPGVDPKKIDTEVILLPGAYFMEKEGTITGAGRLVQWRWEGVKPPGSAKPDLEIFDTMFRKVRELYKGSTAEKDQPILKAAWNYPAKGMAEAVLQEMNGRNLATGEMIGGIGELQADGSTSSGVWIYAGCYKGGKNLTKRRDSQSDPSGLGIYPNYAWTWPGNIHILYNRASCDAKGKPWAGTKPVIWWDEAAKKWMGHDAPDVSVATDGPDTANGQKPFRMAAEGVGRLLAAVYKDPDPKNPAMPRDSSYVLKDGPFPEQYEPVESPTVNVMHPAVQINPAVKYPRNKERQPIGTKKDFPYVLMTSSMTEHWCAGSTTRNVPWLNELAPEPVVEIPEKLAKKLNVVTGDKVKVSSARGSVVVKAVVTIRMKTLLINGQETTIVWMPYNWGFKGLSTGPSTNYLTIDAVDPVSSTQETKACLVNVVRAEKAGAVAQR